MNRSYKQVMEQRVRILIGSAVLGLLAVAAAFLVKRYVMGEMQVSAELFGQVAPFLIPFEVVLIIRIVRYRRILKDDEKLEAMEIAELDERAKQIRHSASRFSVWLLIILLAVAALVAYFFSKVVYLTLGVTLIVVLVVYGVSWLVYAKMY